MEAPDASPELPPEILYHVAKFLPRRAQLELARASRSALELVAPLAFRRFHCGSEIQLLCKFEERLDLWLTNGWLGFVKVVDVDMAAVSRFAGASQVRRLFENAPSVVSAKLSLTLGEEMDAVLGVVSKTLEHLELFDFRKNRRGGAMFDFPCLRSLVYASYVMNEDDRTLSRIVSKLPDLEDLSLNLLTSDGFDAAKLLGPELLCKVRTWIVHSQPAFRALCSVSSFRPRRIVVEREMDDVFGYERSELDEQTVEAISKLPSLQELELDHVASRLVVDYGLPPDLEKLSIKDLEVTAHECDDGVATLAGILGSRPGLRLHVRNVIAAAEESGGFSEECQEEIDLWTQYNVDVAELNPTFDESSSEASSFEDDE